MGIPIANIFDAWNGLDHTEDPVANGYTQEDNIHPNELGATVIAQVLRDLGYEPIIP
jgi:lysophospholipase L1-like esterase